MQSIAHAALPCSPNATETADARALQVDPARAGMDPARVARAIEKFRSQQEAGVFPGGQLVVRRHGHLVVDEAVGIARGFRVSDGEPRVAFTRELRSSLCSAKS
jgi:CubicO group peptidase (beta-lactamase class C family)